MATLRQDLGPVTAYAYAVSEGYTGTEEEFAEVLANFADSAEQVAADAAQVALDKGAVHDDKEAVDSAEGRVTSAVNTFTTTTAPNAVTAVENAGAAQIGLVEAEGTRQIGLVADKGTEQVGTVSSEGTTQIGLVEAKGAEVIASIPGDYSTLQGDIASTYSSSSTYAVGDYVLYSGQLYRCTTAISTAEAWTSAKWTAVALGDDVSDLKSAITEKTYNLVSGIISQSAINGTGSIYGTDAYDMYYAPVEANKKYTIKTNDSSGLVCGFYQSVPTMGTVSYNSSRTIQSAKTITAPIDGYIAFRTLVGYNQAQIVEGETEKNYLPPISATDYILRHEYATALENVNVKPNNIDNGIFKNMFDKSTSVDGYYVDHASGTYNNQSSTYWRSGFIPVKPNTSYTSNSYNRVAFYDENKTFIANSGHYGDYSYTSPNNAAYIMVCNTPLASKDTYVLAETANYDGLYYPYGVYIPWLIESKSRLAGKKMVCFGDSITNMGYTNTIFANLGIEAENVGLSSGRYANVENETIDAFSFYNVVYAIANNDWTIPDTLEGKTGYETQYAKIQAIKGINFNQIDFVSIAYGTNDFSSGTDFDNENNPFDPSYFKGAMRYCIKTLLETYPHIKLLIATPCYRFWQEGGVFVDDCNTHEINGKKLSDYVNAEISVCEEIHVPFVDNLTYAGINRYNRTQYFDANDGLHPNANGRAIIGGRIADGLLNNY